MKQNILIAALLAGMMALAGCGGGSSSAPATGTGTGGNGGGTKTAAETTSEAIAACADDACVDGEIEKAAKEDSGVSETELAELKTEAETKKTALAANAQLSDIEQSAADELVDALAGSEALKPEIRHINTRNAELDPNEPWKEGTGNAIGGWEARSYNIPNPSGSSGRIQDIRIWQENPVYLSQDYDEFFTSGKGNDRKYITVAGVRKIPSNDEHVAAGDEGVITLMLGPGFDKTAVPSNFFTDGFTWNAGFDRTPDDDTDSLNGRWELRGDFVDVPGIFVCMAGPCVQQTVDVSGTETTKTVSTNHGDFNKPSDPITLAGNASETVVHFVPSNFDEDETQVNAKWAQLQNPNFLSFGVYWNSEINDDGETTSISVDPFAGGGTQYTDAQIKDIVKSGEGNLTAKYSGGAAGVYVRTMIDANDDKVATGYGEFTADANFTAVFGTSKDSLSGTINNFATINGNGADADNAWEVELSGDIKSAEVNVKDVFHAEFYGEPNGKTQSNGHGYAPYGLVGTFQSGDQLDTGHVTGAFGTECDGSNCVQN